MVKAVIFDLDQTLIDRAATFKRFLVKQYKRFQNELQPMSLAEFSAAVQHYDKNGYTPKQEVYALVCAEQGIADALLNDFLDNYGQEPSLFSETLFVLEQLQKHYLLGLISNGRSKSQQAKIDRAGIRHYFSSIKISEEEGVKKPDPIIFERCLKELGVTSQQAVYIGDHPQNDVMAARAAGLKGIWRSNLHYEPPECSDGIIDSLTELPDLLSRYQ